jgi:hypothetical protein
MAGNEYMRLDGTNRDNQTEEEFRQRLQTRLDEVQEVWRRILDDTSRIIKTQTVNEHEKASKQLWNALHALDKAKSALINAQYPGAKAERKRYKQIAEVK